MDVDIVISRDEAFFALVNGEILVWNEVEAALRSAGAGITLGRFIALYRLALAEEPLRLRELAKRCFMRESAISRLVERMCEDGLVAKEPDERDRRGVRLRITKRGRDVEMRARAIFHEKLAELFGACSAEQLDSASAWFAALSGKAGEHE